MPITVTGLAVTPVKGDAAARGRRHRAGRSRGPGRPRLLRGRRARADGQRQAVHAAADGRRRLRPGPRSPDADLPRRHAVTRRGRARRARSPPGSTAAGRAQSFDGPWSEALSAFFEQPLRLVAAGPARSTADGTARVSVVSRASLARLAEVAERDAVDGRRFRMLIEVDGVERPRGGPLGRPARARRRGAAAVRGHVGRCLITSRDPDTGEADLRHARPAARSYRGDDRTPPSRCRSASTARCWRAGRCASATRSRWTVGPRMSDEQRVRDRGRRPRRRGHADARRQAQRARRGDVRADHRRRRRPGRRAGGVRAVVLHGEGPSFCCGLDVVSIMAAGNGLDGPRGAGPRRGAQLVSARRPWVA